MILYLLTRLVAAYERSFVDLRLALGVSSEAAIRWKRA